MLAPSGELLRAGMALKTQPSQARRAIVFARPHQSGHGPRDVLCGRGRIVRSGRAVPDRHLLCRPDRPLSLGRNHLRTILGLWCRRGRAPGAGRILRRRGSGPNEASGQADRAACQPYARCDRHPADPAGNGQAGGERGRNDDSAGAARAGRTWPWRQRRAASDQPARAAWPDARSRRAAGLHSGAAEATRHRLDA